MNDIGYLEQLEKYYARTLKGYEVIEVGETPKYLVELGAKPLPIIMKQSVLTKVTREPKGSRSAHSMRREDIVQIPEIIKSPAFLIQRSDSNRVALITDCNDRQDNPMLVALELGVTMHGKEVNSVTSFYGREHFKEYIERQENVLIVDEKRAKILSRVHRLQLPTASKVLDYINSVPFHQENVKEILSQKLIRTDESIILDIRSAGFMATKSLLENIKRLDLLTGKENTMKSICEKYKEGRFLDGEERGAILSIAHECKQQELHRQMVKDIEPEP